MNGLSVVKIMLIPRRSIVVDYLESTFPDSKSGIAYVYCSYKEQSQSMLQLLGSLLQQLARQRPILSDEISNLYYSHSPHNSCPSLTDLSSLLKSESGSFERLFVIVDALDECTEEDDERARFVRTVLNSIPKVYLLVTSRDIATIDNEIGPSIRLDISANPQDVQHYILDQCQSSPKLSKHCREDPTLQDEIVETILRNLEGM